MLKFVFLLALAVAAYGVYSQWLNTDDALPWYQRVWQSVTLTAVALYATVMSWIT